MQGCPPARLLLSAAGLLVRLPALMQLALLTRRCRLLLQASPMPDPALTPMLNSTTSGSGFATVNGSYSAEFLTRYAVQLACRQG